HLPRPRKLNPAVPTDLETVVLKAAARDPAHRYQTPGELADDLRRFLDDRPVRARRAGPLERAWRWAWRNPTIAGFAAAVFLIMGAGTVVSVVGYTRVSEANRETQRANREVAKALGEATAANEKTQEANRRKEQALIDETAQREHSEKVSALALDALNRTYRR